MSSTIKGFAKDAGISDADFDRLEDAMAGVQAVLNGEAKAPGGNGCIFPHCSCNCPWDKCELTCSQSNENRNS